MAACRNEILKLSTKLMNCVRKNDIIGARSLFSDITDKEDRKLIVSKGVYCNHCNAPLFEAVVRGNAAMVSFLVKECYADLEERGVHFENELVTPLGYAAATNKLDVVTCLIDLGADIDAPSTCGRTPVLSACALSNSAVAECLIRYGADVRKKNKLGQTCLMKAVTIKELCQCLIDSGVKVMDQDEFGCLALHHAIRRNQPDTVQLLLDHGSDPYVKNKAGDDAFRTASLDGKKLILDELLFKFKPSVQRWIESYQLLGGCYVIHGNDINKAIHFWKEAVAVQQKNSGVEIISSKPNPVYLFAQEVNTLEELEALARNRESVHMYALMTRERILGPNHNSTISALFKRGESYKRTGETRRCLDIWKHAFLLQSSDVRQLTDDYFYNFRSLSSVLLHNLFEEVHTPDCSDDQLTLINDSLEVLKMVTIKLERTLGNKPAGTNSEGEIAGFMKRILLILMAITDLDSNAYQVGGFRNIVYRLLRCQLRTEHSRTLLHLSISPIPFFHDSRGYMLLSPSIAVIKLLLECGANVDEVDDEHNTALLLCSKAIQEHGKEQRLQDRDSMKNLAELFLKHDAHVDIFNFSGDSAAEILTSSLTGWNIFVSLKCLAARAVLKYDIPYIKHMPTSLKSFVQMHGAPTRSI